MSILTAADLADLRAVAAGQMIDACTIAHRTGQTTDPDTGAVVDTYDAPFYTGPCTVLMPSGIGTDVHVLGEELATQNQLTVCVPWDSESAVSDDRLTITGSVDASLTGRKLRVESFQGQTWLVERRYVCEESTTPDA